MKVGQEIERRRVSKDVQQAHVASVLGRSQGWISLVERGVIVPDKDFVEKIFAAINVIAELKEQECKKRASHLSERLAGLRLPSRLEIANRP